jgi:sigma-B regulation protein RsbU (phosphoserine phosphatase)
MGDECLYKIAQSIQNTIYRSDDLLARYGGEEFVVILPNTDSQKAMIVAENIHNAIRAASIPHLRSQVDGIVTASLGISSIIPRPELCSSLLVTQADQALYNAKRKGRNRSEIYST